MLKSSKGFKFSSITVHNLFELAGHIQRDAELSENFTSYDLRNYFQEKRIHPQKAYPNYFSEAPPVAALTYQWTTTFLQLKSFLNEERMVECNIAYDGSLGEAVPTDMKKLTVWIDIFFINQNAKNISMELEQAWSILFGISMILNLQLRFFS
jgi:hypothetical protein